jgi:hypothetical protein
MHGQAAKAAGLDPELLIGTLASDMPEEIATLQSPAKVHHLRQISDEEQAQMMAEVAAGGSTTVVEQRFGVARGYLHTAMKRKFGSVENYKRILQGLVLENAVAVQMIAQEKLPELTAAQAVFAGKLLVDTHEKIEKSIQNTPKTVNFGQLEKVTETLKSLRQIVDKASETTGK